ncbi:glycoside hydrolase family 125 protein [Auriscalpium vulgare]|uniref:Glycoside hydrolase family 125 protein n=1 Tax=Auriscalpium vulgare TaxID=40419 RepID=A0ACB8RZ45_9AGAM|nr:glycoside hydrolase family 125 protein [Auriscalpium vulgare]
MLKHGISVKSTMLAALGATMVVAQGCPDYTTFSEMPQGNSSAGTLKLPYMRPAPICRTFNSSAVEKVIQDITSRMKDPDIARLFENTFPNTLDTTIKYFNATENLAFIITGDITAQWLRDTANQLAVYRPLLASDNNLATLVKAVINNEARYVAQYPYCGAFQPPPESGLSPTHNDWADGVAVNPPVDPNIVFECKYEIDSLCGFIKLSRGYYEATGDASILNDNWKSAIDQIFRVISEQSQGSFDQNFNFVSYYSWTGGNGALSPAVNNNGNGEPKAYTGLVGTHHRPSDDLSVFAFLTPANAMLSVELTHLADMLDKTGQSKNVSAMARRYSATIEKAIWDTTVVDDIFAYEINGYGGRYVMDDANVPSLLSLPYLGFLEKDHPAYLATRKLLLSRGNPYYSAGKTFGGIGGPHIDAWNPWPMSQISAIFGTDDDDEILQSLYTIANNTNGLGLIHESQNIYSSYSYTRPWFAWANSYFAEMILDLAQRKPHLIFKTNTPYNASNASVPVV